MQLQEPRQTGLPLTSCMGKEKRKENVQQQLNKSLEQGLNLSGS
jgi:hypothetical protein